MDQLQSLLGMSNDPNAKVTELAGCLKIQLALGILLAGNSVRSKPEVMSP